VPKVIRNPLREGLSSKIYLLAYNGPITGYRIAEKINGKSAGSVPQTAKIYGVAKKLLGSALKKTEEGYISLSEPVLHNIEWFFFDRNIDFSELESYMLGKVLDDEYFRRQVERSFFYQKNFFKSDVDAIRQITEVLGIEAMYASIFDVGKQDVKFKKEFDAFWDEYKNPLTVEPLSIKDKLQDETLELLNVLENDRDWHDTGHLAQTLDLTAEDMKEIVDALTKSRFIEAYGSKIRIGERSPDQLSFWPEEAQKKFEQFRVEDDYFQKTGQFLKDGIYERDEQAGRLARDGKTLKFWGGPTTIGLLPRDLIEKLCNLSSAYNLFQRVLSGPNKHLFELWRDKKAREKKFFR